MGLFAQQRPVRKLITSKGSRFIQVENAQRLLQHEKRTVFINGRTQTNKRPELSQSQAGLEPEYSSRSISSVSRSLTDLIATYLFGEDTEVNGRKFVLPIHTLLDIFKQQRASGMLQGQFQKKEHKGMCVAEIGLEQGVLSTCNIRAQNGYILLQGEKAWNALPSHAMEWIFFPALPAQVRELSPYEASPQPAIPFRWEGNRIPCRRVNPTPYQAERWTRQQRRAFGLVDGRKTLAEIASLLGTSLQEVETALESLSPSFVYFDS